MSLREVLHRLSEARRKRAWRNERREWGRVGPTPLAMTSLDAFAAAASGAWPDGVTRAVAATVRTLDAGHLDLLGQRWSFPDGSIPWLRDPVSGTDWPGPELYCFDVPYRHERRRGDIKYMWELNRLQFLPALAFEAARTGDAARARRVVAILRSWMEANPPLRGSNWNSGIELGLRVVSVVAAIGAIGAMISAEDADDVSRFLAAHGEWLARFPSLHSSANNHRVAEALGLLLAGAAIPTHPKAAGWASLGEAVVLEQLGLQFGPDGVGLEQSPTYAAFTLEMIALAALAVRASGRAVPSEAELRLARAAEWLNAMMDEDGGVPRIGDDDETRVLAQPPDGEPRYVASVVAAMAGLLGRDDLAPPRRDPHLRDLLFGSPPAGRRHPTGLRSFPSGYSTVHDRLEGRELLLVFDHGPVGYLSIAAHGHADTLGVWMHWRGRPVLVDAGTYLYHSGDVWRDAMRSTGVHNTATIAGQDSSRSSGPFMWSETAQSRLLVSEGQDGGWRVAANHDGFRRRFGLTHRREISAAGDHIRIEDRFEGPGRNDLPATISFLLHPELAADRTDRSIEVTRSGLPVLTINPGLGCRVELVRGDEARRLGWYSARFGQREPATQILLHVPARPKGHVTELVPR